MEFFLSYLKYINFVLKFSGQTLLNSEKSGSYQQGFTLLCIELSITMSNSYRY